MQMVSELNRRQYTRFKQARSCGWTHLISLLAATGLNLSASPIASASSRSDHSKLLVLFIHGLGSSKKVWKDLPDLLKESLSDKIEIEHFQYRSGRVDICDRLSPFTKRATIRELAETLRTEIEVVYPDRQVVLVTHSLGGVIAAQMMSDLKKSCPRCLDRIVGVAFFAGPFLVNDRAKLASNLAVTSDLVRELSSPDLDKIVKKWKQDVSLDLPVKCILGNHDDIVKKLSAHAPCPDPARTNDQLTVNGDHTSIVGIKKKDQKEQSPIPLVIIKNLILTAAENAFDSEWKFPTGSLAKTQKAVRALRFGGVSAPSGFDRWDSRHLELETGSSYPNLNWQSSKGTVDEFELSTTGSSTHITAKRLPESDANNDYQIVRCWSLTSSETSKDEGRVCVYFDKTNKVFLYDFSTGDSAPSVETELVIYFREDNNTVPLCDGLARD